MDGIAIAKTGKSDSVGMIMFPERISISRWYCPVFTRQTFQNPPGIQYESTDDRGAASKRKANEDIENTFFFFK